MKSKNYAKRTARDYHLGRTIFQLGFIYIIIQFFSKFFYNIKVVGRENLPDSSQVIYAPNHVSELDPPLVSWAVRRPIAYMAKKELFKPEDKRSWLIKALGAFAVDRDKPEMATFKTAKEVFKTQWALGIFPEGGIFNEGQIKDIRRGFVILAKHAKADIIPVSVCGFDGYAKKFFEKNITIVIGKPISHQLETDEIIQQWCAEICKNTGFKNCMLAEKETEKV